MTFLCFLFGLLSIISFCVLIITGGMWLIDGYPKIGFFLSLIFFVTPLFLSFHFYDPNEKADNTLNVDENLVTPSDQQSADDFNSTDSENVKQASDELQKNSTIGCRDGTQIVIVDFGSGSGGAYVRLHVDGKPYTCSESKDPTEEVHS